MIVSSIMHPESVGARLLGRISGRPSSVRSDARGSGPSGASVLEGIFADLTRCVLVSRDAQFASRFARLYLSSLGGSNAVGAFTDAESAMDDALQRGTNCLVLVDVDSVGLENVAGKLLEFRELAPEHVVLLVSRDFPEDSFSRRRRFLTDGCLKLPLASDRLVWGIAAAYHNNRFRAGP